ncbi:hypothetical protein DERF_008668 [Dermatophagoides farinae]|uniref:Uncharacterized protein n=1 Tax=Dermatophagoides farinae TaxID=6954 RepID=A0A922L5P9_DERFA|nr:hypothetical protein DERF_008668 [Dermatophagoides farinae]
MFRFDCKNVIFFLKCFNQSINNHSFQSITFNDNVKKNIKNVYVFTLDNSKIFTLLSFNTVVVLDRGLVNDGDDGASIAFCCIIFGAVGRILRDGLNVPQYAQI